MSLQRWQETLITAQGPGTTLSNSVTPTSILPAQAKFLMPGNYLGDVGKQLRLSAVGSLSNVITTPGTLTLDIRLGGTVVFSSGAMQLSTTAHTTVPWWWQVLLTLRAVGATANFMGQSMIFSQAVNVSGADLTQSHAHLMGPNTAPAVGGNFDSTTTNQLDVFATFSVATNPTNITLQQYNLESLN